MRGNPATKVNGNAILAHFRQRRGHGRGQYLHSVTYHLMKMILDQKECAPLESLIEFCDTPDNLRRWLPAEADRIIFSDGLSQGLREIALKAANDRSSASQERHAAEARCADLAP